MVKKRKIRIKKKTKRIVVFGFVSLIVILGVSISVYKIIHQIMDKYKEANELEEKMADLQEKEEELNKEINKLQDKDYLARYAREKYFYSKDGELIIRIPNEKNQ